MKQIRAALLLACLAGAALPLHAADPTATERLMAMAACIHDAGDMKGAPRETFMKDCMARKARTTLAAPAASAAEPVLPGQPVAPVAPPKPDALPPQERILACATASKAMQGEVRAAYLKQCLRQDQAAPALVAARQQHRADCAGQARLQPEEERRAFLTACMSDAAPSAVPAMPQGVVAPGVINQATVPVLRDDGAARQRAACVVGARDLQGSARKVFIERCIATHAQPQQAAVAPAPVNGQPRLDAQARLTRSKACADEARGQALVGEQIMAFMNACMARP